MGFSNSTPTNMVPLESLRVQNPELRTRSVAVAPKTLTPYSKCLLFVRVFLGKTWCSMVNTSLKTSSFSRGPTSYTEKRPGIWWLRGHFDGSGKQDDFTRAKGPAGLLEVGTGCGSELNDRRGKPQVLVPMFPLARASHFGVARLFEPQPHTPRAVKVPRKEAGRTGRPPVTSGHFF